MPLLVLFLLKMNLITFKRLGYFTFDAKDFFASYNYQLEDEDPILIRRFVDCVR